MWLLREHHGDLEYDFDERGWDLLDLYRGNLSPRKVWLRIKRLPASSATRQSMDPDGTAWDTSEHLLALIADLLAAGNWQRSGDKHAKRPSPLKRPKDVAAAEERNQTIRERALAQRARKLKE